MDEHGQNGTILHHSNSIQIQNVNANLNGLGGLEVRELCTISEEEGDEAEDGIKLMKLEQLERMKLKHGGGDHRGISPKRAQNFPKKRNSLKFLSQKNERNRKKFSENRKSKFRRFKKFTNRNFETRNF